MKKENKIYEVPYNPENIDELNCALSDLFNTLLKEQEAKDNLKVSKKKKKNNL